MPADVVTAHTEYSAHPRSLALIAACSRDGARRRERWGISIWGLSYHVDRSVDYNEDNWGLGVRYYLKPDRCFVEVDALRNSNRGLVVPASARRSNSASRRCRPDASCPRSSR